jgi:hypothetical protein
MMGNNNKKQHDGKQQKKQLGTTGNAAPPTKTGEGMRAMLATVC